ncbi:hypothetical protein EB001_07990 [bacterium]|nr:hypothetical protein [bacterium]
MEERVPRPIKAYIIVENPIEKPKTKIKLSEADQLAFVNDQLAKVQKVKIIAVGPQCESVKVGDEVKIKTADFMRGEPMCGEKYIAFTEGNVVAIY